MYDPFSGNDDDQYIELYNRGTNPVSLANWQFTSGVTFSFPAGTMLASNGYLVVARNWTNLLAKVHQPQHGQHPGQLWGQALAQGRTRRAGQAAERSNGTGTIYVVEDEVTYGTGGRWGQWAHGGGSSLELINPNSNHRLAYNWADSDETRKSVWTNLEFTGVLDLGGNYASTD